MVHQCQKSGKCASPEVEKISRGIDYDDADEFASTKHKGLPEKKKPKKKKKRIREIVAELGHYPTFAEYRTLQEAAASKRKQVQDAQWAVQSAQRRLFELEDALRDAEKRIPPMAAVFDTWRSDLRQKDRTGSMRGEIDALPDHPAAEQVKFYKSYVARQQQVVDQALKELARVQTLPDDPPPPEPTPMSDEEWEELLNRPHDGPNVQLPDPLDLDLF